MNKDHLYQLLYIRHFEKALLDLFKHGHIAGTTHTCLGQEEIPVAVIPFIQPQDFVFSNHRGHGHYLAYFKDGDGLLSEIMGKDGAVCGGLGGSQHIKRDNYLSTGIQGECLPVALGTALTIKTKALNGISLCFIGDGTWGQGIVYETLNMASLYQLPLVLICENNGIAQSTPVHKNMAGTIESRVRAFGIDFYKISQGTDVSAMQDILTPVLTKSRNEGSPVVIEIDCVRLGPHSKGDDERSAENLNALSKKDWYTRFKLEFVEVFVEIEKEVIASISATIDLVINKPDANATPNIQKIEQSPIYPHSDSTTDESLLQNLNRALHQQMHLDDNLYIIGEDILDPYGGAFKVTKGLSTAFPTRLISTPISEQAIAGLGNGIAFAGDKAIVEFMFADFSFLAFDQIVNFASKVVSNYNHKVPMHVLFRCPVGGGRGYGSTHSQSIQKYFMGTPNLSVFELSPLHNSTILLPELMQIGCPAMLFEPKTNYAKNMIPVGTFQAFLVHEKIDLWTSHVFIDDAVDIVLMIGGNFVYEGISLVKDLYIQHEIRVHLINPFQLYPFNFMTVLPYLRSAKLICIVEEGTPGVDWGSEITSHILRNDIITNPRVISICSNSDIIPSASHLEKHALISAESVARTLMKKWAELIGETND